MKNGFKLMYQKDLLPEEKEKAITDKRRSSKWNATSKRKVGSPL
jgi:hypothetical protein